MLLWKRKNRPPQAQATPLSVEPDRLERIRAEVIHRLQNNPQQDAETLRRAHEKARILREKGIPLRMAAVELLEARRQRLAERHA